MQSRTNKKQALHGKFLGSKQGLRRSTKSCTRKEHESATNSIAKRGQGGNSPLQGQGTASLVGFGATPQLFLVRPTPKDKSTRRRQRSVPAPNFARPQTRPQLALSATRTLSRQMGATESQQGQQPPSAADPVFRFNHPMPASTASSHSVASSSSQSSSQPSSSQSSSSSVCPIPLNADGRAVPTNISSLSANIIR